MRNIVLLIIISFFTIQHVSAQVKGVVVDSANNKPLENAVVGLFTEANRSDTTYTITNGKGEFKFDAVPHSNFSVIITSIGYKNGSRFRRIYGSEKIIELEPRSLSIIQGPSGDSL